MQEQFAPTVWQILTQLLSPLTVLLNNVYGRNAKGMAKELGRKHAESISAILFAQFL